MPMAACDIHVKPYQVTVFSTSFNRLFYLLANCHPWLINKWFAVGAVLSIGLMPTGLFILITSLISVVWPSPDTSKKVTLDPVIPGVNLPLGDFIYYFVSLALISVFHEVGHATAAVREGVRVHGFGMFLTVVLPGAYVDLSTEQVFNLRIWNQLKIFTAGVWHNLALSVFAMLLLLANPLFLAPLYRHGHGAVVGHIDLLSGAAGPMGLRQSDLIVQLDDCSVVDTDSWKACLVAIASNPPTGYCSSREFVDKEQSFSLDPNKCCDENSARNLCFVNQDSKRSCLPARQLLQKKTSTCSISNPCPDNASVCLTPVAEDERIKLIEIKRLAKDSVIFWGSPAELFQAVTPINYWPKMSWLPLIFIYRYEKFLKYLISFSLALAVLNAIPCVYLDGQWVTKALVEAVFRNRLNNTSKKLLSNVLIFIGTISLASYVFVGVYQLFRTLF